MPKELLNDEELIRYLDGLEKAGMAVTKQWHSIFREAILYMWGEQLAGIKKKPGWDYVCFNYIYPLVMQGIAKEAKNNPKILGRAWNDEDTEFAEQWQGIIQYIWEQILNMRLDELQALLDAACFGYAVGKTIWNPKKYWNEKTKEWEGEIEHIIIHPAYFWVDTTAETLKNKPACGTIRPVSLEWAISKWPEFEEELRKEADNSGTDEESYRCSDMRYSASSSASAQYPNQKAGILRRITSYLVSLIFGQKEEKLGETGNKTKEVWLKETYFPDETTKHIKIEESIPQDELINSGEMYIETTSGTIHWSKDKNPVNVDDWPKRTINEYDEPIFPKGRCVIRVGKTILNPEIDDQKYQYSRWPFNVMPHHILPHMWQGSNAVEMNRATQDTYNLTMAQLIHFVKVSSDPVKIIEENTIAKDRFGKQRRITGASGEQIIVQQGKIDKIRRLEHGTIGSEVPFLVEMLRRDMETNLFMHPTAQGAVDPKQMTRAEALTANANANDMVALRGIIKEKWIEGTAINIGELAQANYDIQRRLRIVGTDGNTANALMTEKLKSVEFNLEIEPGSTLPYDEDRRKNDYAAAYKFLGDPVANPLLEDMLRILNIANRQKVLAKHQQTLVFKQFIALAQEYMQVQAQIQQAANTPPSKGQKPNESADLNELQAKNEKANQIQIVQQQFIQKVMALMQQVAQMVPQKGAA